MVGLLEEFSSKPRSEPYALNRYKLTPTGEGLLSNIGRSSKELSPAPGCHPVGLMEMAAEAGMVKLQACILQPL
jgi:hypothetical protein